MEFRFSLRWRAVLASSTERERESERERERGVDKKLETGEGWETDRKRGDGRRARGDIE